MDKRLEKLEERYKELEVLLSKQETLSDTEQYNRLAKEFSDLKDPVQLFREHKKACREMAELEEMLKENHARDFVEMADKEITHLKEKVSAIEQKLKEELRGDDKDIGKNVIVEIRQGTGGNEATLFAADLYRMYTKYAARRNWTVELMSANATELGGFKEVAFSIIGRDAYKRLKFESGVHRVQRVPETEAQGRIHTSTATVAILVEPQEVELAINPADLKIDTYRSSGPGGQHMQKTDSAVRITHIPSGIVVACQDERSQIKNKAKAMRVLRAKLLDKKNEEELKRVTEARRSQIGTGDRSEKIRTYNFPDRRVTDHRINLTLYSLEKIMDGDLDELSDGIIKAAEAKANE